ncbi:hypothetical protein YC2023_018381 [Brassica napus]
MHASTASVSQAGGCSSSVILSENITYIAMDLQSNNVLKAATQISLRVKSIGGEGFYETGRNLKRSQAIEAHPASFS